MAVPHNLRAPTNPYAPDPVGICRRCAFLWPIAQLVEQWEWRGPSLGKILTRVCPSCLDEPNEQLRTIIVGPDGIGPEDASPTFYDQQNQGGPAILPIGQILPLQD